MAGPARRVLAVVAMVAVIGGPSAASHWPATAGASDFPGWAATSTIAYSPSEDGPEKYLAEAAHDLEAHLEKVRPGGFTVTTAAAPSPAVRLEVRPKSAALASAGEDAFVLTSDSSGVTITAKTPLAARHGAYTLLHDLGYRWFFAHPAWDVVPASLPTVSYPGTVDGPAYEERDLAIPPGFLAVTDTGRADVARWMKHNRLDSARTYPVNHSYEAISPLRRTASTNPEAVCYNPNGSPRNLDPSAPLVVERAKTFGVAYFDTPKLKQQLKMSAPIMPEDGAPKCPDWTNPDGSSDTVKATNGVFSLTNTVAKRLQAARPGMYAGIMSYSVYGEVPTIGLEPNVFVSVGTDFGTVGSSAGFEDRLRGFRAKGVKTGVYDWLNVWQYTHDRAYGPTGMNRRLEAIRTGAAAGATVYDAEAGNNWGAKGRAYWLASQLLWSPSARSEVLLDDFYRSAFGPAAETMRRFFSRFDDQVLTDRVYGLSFRDLDEALRQAYVAGDAAVAERVRQMVLWTYYDWRWGEGVNKDYPFTKAEMTALYSYVWQLTNLHLITVKPEYGAISKRLRSRFGMGDAAIRALEDPRPPSAAQVHALLDEAMSNWKGRTLVHAVTVDPGTVELMAAGSSQPKAGATYGGWQHANLLVPSTGNETITATLTCACPVPRAVRWERPDGTVAAAKTVTGAECRNQCAFPVTTTKAGRYRLMVDTANVKVRINRPAAHDLSQNTSVGGSVPGEAVGAQSGYLYVPPGTPGLVVGTGVGDLTLTDPAGRKQVINGTEFGVVDPAPGLWRLDLAKVVNTKARPVWVFGVPPLVWNDPATLLRPR